MFIVHHRRLAIPPKALMLDPTGRRLSTEHSEIQVDLFAISSSYSSATKLVSPVQSLDHYECIFESPGTF